MDAASSLKGRLLVAAPSLIDENFFRTVVLLLEHNEEGAIGVVLNRPSDTPIVDGPLHDWESLAADPPLIFVGGPVSPSSAVCLAMTSPSEQPNGWQPVLGRLGVLDMARECGQLRLEVDRIRVFAGYAGWAADQLEDEIDEHAWFVVDAEPGDAMSPEPIGLWRRVLKRQPTNLALVANFPLDPAMN